MDFNRFKIFAFIYAKKRRDRTSIIFGIFYACHSAAWFHKAHVYGERKNVWNYAVLVCCNAWTILHKLHNSVYTACNYNCAGTYFNCNYNYYNCGGRLY